MTTYEEQIEEAYRQRRKREWLEDLERQKRDLEEEKESLETEDEPFGGNLGHKKLEDSTKLWGLNGKSLGNGIYAKDGMIYWHGKLDRKKAEKIALKIMELGWDTVWATKIDYRSKNGKMASELSALFSGFELENGTKMSKLFKDVREKTGQAAITVHTGEIPLNYRRFHDRKYDLTERWKKKDEEWTAKIKDKLYDFFGGGTQRRLHEKHKKAAEPFESVNKIRQINQKMHEIDQTLQNGPPLI
jgi:hypothetical protein